MGRENREVITQNREVIRLQVAPHPHTKRKRDKGPHPRYSVASVDVRFVTESDHLLRCREVTLWATSRLMRRSKLHLYSITSSAIARTPDGMVRPSAFAVFRLMTSSNLVGSKTGRSVGFSPLRMRPA